MSKSSTPYRLDAVHKTPTFVRVTFKRQGAGGRWDFLTIDLTIAEAEDLVDTIRPPKKPKAVPFV